ncbi:MAG: hypothetical protein LBB76_02835 [Azoarcus sp.]|jgi:hypothetical protein|nr:hypothetical protein [Azoarcus sp.]
MLDMTHSAYLLTHEDKPSGFAGRFDLSRRLVCGVGFQPAGETMGMAAGSSPHTLDAFALTIQATGFASGIPVY